MKDLDTHTCVEILPLSLQMLGSYFRPGGMDTAVINLLNGLS